MGTTDCSIEVPILQQYKALPMKQAKEKCEAYLNSFRSNNLDTLLFGSNINCSSFQKALHCQMMTKQLFTPQSIRQKNRNDATTKIPFEATPFAAEAEADFEAVLITNNNSTVTMTNGSKITTNQYFNNQSIDNSNPYGSASALDK